jgi:hypothetical protein
MLPSAGQISISSLRTELGLSSTLSLGQSEARALSNIYSGTLSLSSFYSKSAPVVDPYFSTVVSLMHFNSDSTDVKGNVWSPVGSAVVSAAGKFGGSTLLTAGQSFTTPSATPFNFTTFDFTIEGWINMSSASVDAWQVILMRAVPETWNPGWSLFYQGTSNKIGLWVNNAIQILSNTIVTRNTWVHVAVVRYSGIWLMFVGGVLQTQTYTNAASVDTANLIRIGGDSVNYSFVGNLDDIRVSKLARYTIPFTPPTSAFPNA